MIPLQDERAERAEPEECRLVRMSREEFTAFYEQTAPALRRYLSRIAGPGAADDLLQEAYIRLLDVAPLGEVQRRAYLYRAATNVAVDRHRAERRERSGLLSWLRGRRMTAEPNEAGPLIERVFRTLTFRERALLWLAYGEGATHEEIASALGLRQPSVKVLLFRARQKMAGRLKGVRE